MSGNQPNLELQELEEIYHDSNEKTYKYIKYFYISSFLYILSLLNGKNNLTISGFDLTIILKLPILEGVFLIFLSIFYFKATYFGVLNANVQEQLPEYRKPFLFKQKFLPKSSVVNFTDLFIEFIIFVFPIIFLAVFYLIFFLSIKDNFINIELVTLIISVFIWLISVLNIYFIINLFCTYLIEIIKTLLLRILYLVKLTAFKASLIVKKNNKISKYSHNYKE